MALIALFAYIYNQSNFLKRLIQNNFKIRNKILIVIFFSVLGIIGNYTGVSIGPYSMNEINISSRYLGRYDAIANARPIASIVSGFIYGPVVGIMVGLISGTHRYFLGGFTALACGISTVIEGLIGGIVGKKFKNTNLNIKYACVAAVIAECIQMIIILIFSNPFSAAFRLVKIVAVPMILINSLGTIIFISIIKSSKEECDRIGAIEAQKALNIAKKTLKYMRKGLNIETAKNISEIIYKITNIDGIFIGNKDGFLTCLGEDIHEKNIENFLNEYYKSPKYKIIEVDTMFFICAPFNISNSGFEGVLGLGMKSKKNITIYFTQFVEELSELLSNQIELYRLNKLAEEVSTAKFRALQAQIEPHFLFNALNTISSFCRTNPLKAKELIIDLSNYFRKTLKRHEDFVYLKDEVEFIQSYFSIEKARFGNRLKLTIDIPNMIMNIKVPSFILQPIVENSVKHGILPKAEGGSIYIKVLSKNNEMRFSIEDTGIGMNEEKLNDVLVNWPGIGLKNVNEKLKLLYGKEHGLNIKTSLNSGTKVSFIIPMKEDSSLNG
jgi:two-component system LytT family sensor kinase